MKIYNIHMGIDEARREVIKAEKKLEKAQKAYLSALKADDKIGQVAFILYQQFVGTQEDWEGPVTWKDWWDLTIESERDEWRKLAAEVVSIIEGE